MQEAWRKVHPDNLCGELKALQQEAESRAWDGQSETLEVALGKPLDVAGVHVWMVRHLEGGLQISTIAPSQIASTMYQLVRRGIEGMYGRPGSVITNHGDGIIFEHLLWPTKKEREGGASPLTPAGPDIPYI